MTTIKQAYEEIVLAVTKDKLPSKGACGLALIALGKRKKEKPNYEGDGCDDNGNIIYGTLICPCCNTYYEVDYVDYKYCPECGQAWDRSSEEAEEAREENACS